MPASRRQKIVFWSVFTPLALLAILVIAILFLFKFFWASENTMMQVAFETTAQ